MSFSLSPAPDFHLDIFLRPLSAVLSPGLCNVAITHSPGFITGPPLLASFISENSEGWLYHNCPQKVGNSDISASELMLFFFPPKDFPHQKTFFFDYGSYSSLALLSVPRGFISSGHLPPFCVHHLFPQEFILTIPTVRWLLGEADTLSSFERPPLRPVLRRMERKQRPVSELRPHLEKLCLV